MLPQRSQEMLRVPLPLSPPDVPEGVAAEDMARDDAGSLAMLARRSTAVNP